MYSNMVIFGLDHNMNRTIIFKRTQSLKDAVLHKSNVGAISRQSPSADKNAMTIFGTIASVMMYESLAMKSVTSWK